VYVSVVYVHLRKEIKIGVDRERNREIEIVVVGWLVGWLVNEVMVGRM